MPFNTRLINNVKFVFPIELLQQQQLEFYIKIDKRNSSVNFPVKLWKQTEFIKVNNKRTLLNGIYFGGLLLAVFYSLIAYVNLKRTLYLFYLLYTLFLGLYMFTSTGYSFQYFGNYSSFINSYFRIITLAFMVFFHAKFLQSLFNTKKNAKRIHLLISFLTNLLLLITVLWVLLSKKYDEFITGPYLKTNYVFILILILLFLVVCEVTYKKQKKIVRLYLLSFFVVLLAGIWSIVEEYGWLPNLKFPISPMYIGSLTEIIMLSIVLISEMRLVLREKEKLSVAIVEKQKEIIQAYVDGIEKEKLRISQELHDDIGSKLSNLNQFIARESNFTTQTRKKMETIIEDVRNISHRLSPSKATIFSFNEQVENVVEEALLNSDIEYRLNILKDTVFLTDAQKLNIYRIVQECIHNIVKHSKASIVEIQLMSVENKMIITIEDDGVGFVLDSKKEGIGITNIRRRVDYLQGRIEISSIPKKGTYITISIPI